MGYEIHWESERGAIRRFFGHVSSNDLVNAILETQADIRFSGLQYVIDDFLGAKGFSVTPGDLDYILAIHSAASLSNSEIKIAVVTLIPEVVDLAHQYRRTPLFAYSIKTFDTLASAKAWLEAPR